MRSRACLVWAVTSPTGSPVIPQTYTRSPCATTRLMIGLKFALSMMRWRSMSMTIPLSDDSIPRRLPSVECI